MNLCAPILPLLRFPVSKLPSVAVAVCGAVSSLVQLTASPTLTVVVRGAKAKFLILTTVEPAARAWGAVRGAVTISAGTVVVGAGVAVVG